MSQMLFGLWVTRKNNEFLLNRLNIVLSASVEYTVEVVSVLFMFFLEVPERSVTVVVVLLSFILHLEVPERSVICDRRMPEVTYMAADKELSPEDSLMIDWNM
jgi:hypothetical protein